MWRIGVPLGLSIAQQTLFGSKMSYPIAASFQPPAYVFPWVWTVLYICLGLYFHRVRTETYAIWLESVFVLGLMVNLSWTPVTIVAKRYVLGIYLIMGMLASTGCLMVATEDVVSRTLLVPYMAWLTIALLLNVELSRKRVRFEEKIKN
jgi:tryptophan-rich sensory protein